MKRPFLVLWLGLAVGTAAHLAYFQHREPIGTDTLDGQLAWMRSELRLTEQQFARIKGLHQATRPQLQAMAAQVALMQEEFAEFEHTRQATDQVDFIEFARFVESRRELNRRCLDTTRQLVLASAEIMTPEQRRQYIRLVPAAEPLVGTLLN
jgi:hypothetical protein